MVKLFGFLKKGKKADKKPAVKPAKKTPKKGKQNEITDGVLAQGLSLWLPKEKVIIIADLHLGFEEMMNAQGIMMPRANYDDIVKRLTEVFNFTGKAKKIIINGDLKHEFGTISPQEWREVTNLLDFLQKNCDEIILLKGNHDTILGPIAKYKNLKVNERASLRKGQIMVLHGHQLPEFKTKTEKEKFKKVKTIIIAHEHPVVGLREDNRVDKYKAFLKGSWERKQLIVMPSLLQVTKGIDVTREKRLSPFLQRNISHFQCWLYEEGNVFWFSKLADLYG